MCEQYPRIARALWRETLIDAAIFREWVMNVGRTGGLCPDGSRPVRVGDPLESGRSGARQHYEIPMTQNEFADALGISTVQSTDTPSDRPFFLSSSDRDAGQARFPSYLFPRKRQ
jgi:hypothetical protein